MCAPPAAPLPALPPPSRGRGRPAGSAAQRSGPGRGRAGSGAGRGEKGAEGKGRKGKEEKRRQGKRREGAQRPPRRGTEPLAARPEAGQVGGSAACPPEPRAAPPRCPEHGRGLCPSRAHRPALLVVPSGLAESGERAAPAAEGSAGAARKVAANPSPASQSRRKEGFTRRGAAPSYRIGSIP